MKLKVKFFIGNITLLENITILTLKKVEYTFSNINYYSFRRVNFGFLGSFN